MVSKATGHAAAARDRLEVPCGRLTIAPDPAFAGRE
jgi:hypothetical protein